MTQVFNHPEKMRDFIATLRVFTETVSQSMNEIRGRTSQLGDSWRDQGFQSFEQELARAQTSLQNLIREAQVIAPRLDTIAGRVEEVQQMQTPRGS